jgi:hypothetical protein
MAWERVDQELGARRAAWLILIGDEVVRSSDDPDAIPGAHEIRELGRASGLVPYVFIARAPPAAQGIHHGGTECTEIF